MTESRAARTSDAAARRADGTMVDVIQIQVRDAILSGAHQPGQKLSLSAMALDHGVSPTVMRVALAALTVEGIVTFEAMAGYRVVQTTITDLEELTELFKANMATAIRQALAKGGPTWEGEIIAAHHVLKRAGRTIADEQQAIEVERAHTAFLEVLASGCGNSRLTALLTALWRSMRLYQHLAVGLLKAETLKRAANCGLVARRAVRGDADGAIAIMNDNIDSATAVCRAYLTAQDQAASAGTGRRKRKTTAEG